jgi:hypothetical protein
MARWRKEAFERLPEMRTTLQEDKSLYCYFFETQRCLEKAIAVGDEDLCKRIYGFVLWCLRDAPRGKTSSDDVFTIVITSFFEDVPNSKVIRGDIRRRLPKDILFGLKNAFMYHGNEEVFNEIIGNENH